jgi:two-component sensor histidine kinase
VDTEEVPIPSASDLAPGVSTLAAERGPTLAGWLARALSELRLGVPSLRLVLALALGTLGLASTLVLSAAVSHEAAKRLETEIAAQLREVAGHMTQALDRGMFERWRDIQVAAANETLRTPSTPDDAKRAILEHLQKTYPDYAILAFVDPAGRLLVTSNRLIEGADVSRRDYFLAGRERPFVGDVHDAILLAKLLPRRDGEPLRLVDLAMPVRGTDGSLVGVVAAHLDWRWAREMARTLADTLRGRREGAEILILASDGTVLLGPPRLEGAMPDPEIGRIVAEAAGPDARTIARWPDGDAYVTAAARTQGHRDYPGLGWTVVVRHKTSQALSAVSDLRGHILLFGSLVALAAALIAWVLAGRITRPLHAIVEAASALGQHKPLPALPRTTVREGRLIAVALEAASAELRQRETARRLLVDELNHRVKNTLATVQAIAAQSFKGLSDADSAGRPAFEARLFALARTHDVLTEENWAGAELHAIVSEVTRPYAEDGEGRFVVEGPHVRLVPRCALALSMALHELCTNAAKYGALTAPQGHVAIRWRVEEGREGRQLELAWQERGGPPVEAPSRKGFGSRLIERGLAAELGGRTDIRYERSGLACTIGAPLAPA